VQASRFLGKSPRLIERTGRDAGVPQLDLYSERQQVRETGAQDLYTGKTYNSVENIHQFLPNAECRRRRHRRLSRWRNPAIRPATKKALGRDHVRHPSMAGAGFGREGTAMTLNLQLSFPVTGVEEASQKFSGIQVE